MILLRHLNRGWFIKGHSRSLAKVSNSILIGLTAQEKYLGNNVLHMMEIVYKNRPGGT